MAYINNVTGDAETINAIGQIESITTIGDVTTITAKAQAQTCKAVGQLGIKKIIEKDYEKLDNKPSINGVVLEGNKTTEDLGIEIPKVDLSNHYTKDEINNLANELVEMIPQIVPLEEYNPEEQYADNQVANANTFNYLVSQVSGAFNDIGQYIEEVRQEAQENIFTVNYNLNPQNMSITYISHYSSDIIQKHNEGKKVTFRGYVLGLNVYVNSELELVDGQYAFTYPLLKVDLGEGEKIYLFKIQISSSSTSVEMNEIGGESGEDNNIFIVEYTLKFNPLGIPTISATQQEIVDAYNEGKKVMFYGSVVGSNIKLISELNTIDNSLPYTYPFLRTDLGEGIYNYFFRIGLYREFGTVEAYAFVDTNKLKKTEETFNQALASIANSRPTTDTVQAMVNYYIHEGFLARENRLLPENVEEGTILKYVDGKWTAVEDNTEEIFTVEYQINPQTMTIINISHYSSDIKQAYNEGKKVTFRGYVLGLGAYVNSELVMVSGNYAYTYPILRTDLGMGMLNYLFNVEIGPNSTNVSVHVLGEITNNDTNTGTISEIEKLNVTIFEGKTVEEIEGATMAKSVQEIEQMSVSSFEKKLVKEAEK